MLKLQTEETESPGEQHLCVGNLNSKIPLYKYSYVLRRVDKRNSPNSTVRKRLLIYW